MELGTAFLLGARWAIIVLGFIITFAAGLAVLLFPLELIARAIYNRDNG